MSVVSVMGHFLMRSPKKPGFGLNTRDLGALPDAQNVSYVQILHFTLDKPNRLAYYRITGDCHDKRQ